MVEVMSDINHSLLNEKIEKFMRFGVKLETVQKLKKFIIPGNLNEFF